MVQRFKSVLYMFVLTALCTGVLSALQVVSSERIAANKKARLQRVILTVLAMPAPVDWTAPQVDGFYSSHVKKVEKDGKTVYLAKDESTGETSGYAFPVEGPGFWGPIYGMMGVSPDLANVLGIAFYEHGETPGLGGRITEPWFCDQFEKKKIAPGEEGRYFTFLPAGSQLGDGEVDAITGATETTRRLQKFLNQDLEIYLDWIQKNLAGASAAQTQGA